MMNLGPTSAQHVMANSIDSLSTAHMNSSMLSDDMSEPSSPETSTFDETDLLANDDVTSQLAAAGPIGVAAAAAIATGRKRKRPHAFETNPSIRKRQQTRLIRKLKVIIEEYTTRVGQQAIVLCVTPGKPNQTFPLFKVFGSQPLENVIRTCRDGIMRNLEDSLAQQAPPQPPENASLHELPPLFIDGIPTPVDKMTQAQLRAFIPEMLKYSTGRSKPGWGKPEYRPVWWPSDLPWANVRSDVRTEDDKKKVSWTHALRTIVKNCYKHHGREDLLPDFHEDGVIQQEANHTQVFAHGTVVQTINNPDGTLSIIQIDTGSTPTGTVVTLADGTQATVVHAVGVKQEASQAVQSLQVTDGANGILSQHVDLGGDGVQAVATLTEATLNQDGQIILTSDTGLGTGILTIPISMYQAAASHGIAALTDVSSAGLQVAMGNLSQATNENQHHIINQHTNNTIMLSNGHNIGVPDATSAVEVMTAEQQGAT